MNTSSGGKPTYATKIAGSGRLEVSHYLCVSYPMGYETKEVAFSRVWS